MNLVDNKYVVRFGGSRAFQTAIFLLIIVVMANVNALTDAVVHPDIPYFDEEHVIVGGITALVSFFIYLGLICYIQQLNNALRRIHNLEKMLPICSYCKRIRKPDTDPHVKDSWQQLESYFSERTSSNFTHGICPYCMVEKFPDVYDQILKNMTEEADLDYHG